MMITYKGYQIKRNEDGLYWNHGGYCEHYSEIEAEIDDFIAEERAFYADIDTPPDTPCLPDRYPF